jgi:hypothetical protein
MNTPHLYGAKDIYAIVFTEYKACLTAHFTTEYIVEPNPFSAIFDVLGKSIGGGGSDKTTADDKDSKPDFGWSSLTGTDNSPMWMAIAPAKVGVNTTNRLTIRYSQPGSARQHASNEGVVRPRPEQTTSGEAAQDCDDDRDGASSYRGDFVAANAFYSNSPDNRVGVAAALGLTFNTKNTGVGPSNQAVNAYGLVKFYLPAFFGLPDGRPQLHAGPDATGYKRSSALVFGTNVVHSSLDEMLVGLSLGHVFGRAGFIAGVNFVTGTTDHPRRFRRPFIGVDYSF